jgi:hypothetical protein
MDRFYQFQRKSLLRAMANGAGAKARDGRWPSSNASAPWCFKVEGVKRDARLVPDPDERAMAELAATLLVDEGKPAKEACALLNAQGMLPRPMRRKVDGKTVLVPLEWNVHRLRLYMTKETLLGKVVWGGGRFAVRIEETGALKYGARGDRGRAGVHPRNDSRRSARRLPCSAPGSARTGSTRGRAGSRARAARRSWGRGGSSAGRRSTGARERSHRAARRRAGARG